MSRQARLLRDRFEPASQAGMGRTTVIVARSRCRLKWFRLNSVPPDERLAALRMQAHAWQPFEQSEYRLVLNGESGLVLAWDRQTAWDELARSGADPERCQWLPETLLRPALDSGMRLLKCLDGVEAQTWKDGCLQSSRWWPADPNIEEWRLFLHAAAAPAEMLIEATVPHAEELSWLARPWVAVHGISDHAVLDAGVRTRVLAILGLALLFGLGFVLHQAWDVQHAIAQREAEIAALKAAAGQALTSRDQAMAKAAAAQQLASWLTEPLPIEVIGHVNEMLGKSGVLIKELDLSGKRLQIGFQLTPQATRSKLVRDLQAGGWFKDVAEVRADGAPGLTVIAMTIDGLRAPATRVADTTSARAKPEGEP